MELGVRWRCACVRAGNPHAGEVASAGYRRDSGVGSASRRLRRSGSCGRARGERSGSCAPPWSTCGRESRDGACAPCCWAGRSASSSSSPSRRRRQGARPREAHRLEAGCVDLSTTACRVTDAAVPAHGDDTFLAVHRLSRRDASRRRDRAYARGREGRMLRDRRMLRENRVWTRRQTCPAATDFARRLPILIIIARRSRSARLRFATILSFEALARNREALLAFRDANYAADGAGLHGGLCALIVAFSLPGAHDRHADGRLPVRRLSGRALQRRWPLRRARRCIFLAARWGAGERLAARMDAGEGLVRRIKAGIDENQWSMLFLIRLVPCGAVLRGQRRARRSSVCRSGPLRGLDLHRDHPRRAGLYLGRRRALAKSLPVARRPTSESSSSRASCCRFWASARWRRCRSCSRPSAAGKAFDGDHQDRSLRDRRRFRRASRSRRARCRWAPGWC